MERRFGGGNHDDGESGGAFASSRVVLSRWCSIGGGKRVLNDDFVGNILGKWLRARANVGERPSPRNRPKFNYVQMYRCVVCNEL